MRRRQSGSEEDVADHSASNKSPTSAPGGRAEKRNLEMVRESGRAAKQQGGRGRSQDRKLGREQGVGNGAHIQKPEAWPPPMGGKVEKAEEPLQSKESAAAVAERQGKHRARLRGPWYCSLLTFMTTLCAIALLATIVRSFLTLQMDPKGCAMSWMAPKFHLFADFDTEHTRFASKYSLYLYREAGVDEDIRVKGIPVLFIPGNAGSYKQVRPIAAEAANYFKNDLQPDSAAVGNGKHALDFFTVDFNEELSAFHGQTLLDQAEYLNEAIAYILALYHNPQRSLREPGLPDPKSVIILGHSMGGVVARTMLRTPNYQENSINTIVTLSTPHARAPISFDEEMVATYNDINTFWRESYSLPDPRKNPLADVTLVSVAGGGLDTMIPSEYSSLTSLVPDTHGFTVFTSAIPRVWTGMDHLAIMWCDQFRKALVKAIFDVVDVRRASQTLPQGQRINALRKRLLTGIESVIEKAALAEEPTTYLALDHSSTAIKAHGKRLVLRSIGSNTNLRAHLLPIPAQPFREGSKFILMTDQELGASSDNASLTALLCSVFPPSASSSGLSFAIRMDKAAPDGAGTRLACKNAASDVTYLPASFEDSVNAFDSATPFSYLQYDVNELHEYQFVAIIEQSKEPAPGWLMAEFSSGSENVITISKGHHQLLMNGLRRKLPANRPLMTELKIPEVHSTMFAYNLRVRKHDCQTKQLELFAPLLRQSIQEPYESKYFVNVRDGNINVHGVSPYMPPPLNGEKPSEGLSLQLWSDPTCNSTIKVSLTVDLAGSAGKLVMRYRAVFASFPLLVVAVVLRKQFKVYDTTGVFISFSRSMDQCIRTSLSAVIAALTFLAVALSKAAQATWAHTLLGHATVSRPEEVDFTVNDLMLGTSDPFFWFLVPLFGVISVGVCIAGNYLVLVLTHLLAHLYGLVRALASRFDFGRTNSTSGGDSTYQRMITTGVLLLLVVTVVPYQFAYVVLCIVQFVTATRALRSAIDDHSGQSYDFYNYTHSMLTLMLWILPINVPVLVVWIHNLAVHWLTPFSTHHNLLSVLPYILLVEAMSTGSMVPRVTSCVRYVTNILFFSFALYAAVYGVTYAYRLHHMVNALCGWLLLIHMSNGPLSLARLSQYLPRTRSKGRASFKKRP